MPDRQIADEHFYRALDLFAEGRREQAVAEYRAAIAADPGHLEALHGLARALKDMERYDEAIEVSERLTQLDSEDVLAHTSLSILYQKKGLIAEAEAEANRARVLGWKQELKRKPE